MSFITSSSKKKVHGESGGGDVQQQDAHHIEEFGPVAKIVHLDDDEHSKSTSGPHKIRQLWNSLFSKRHLQQHFAGDTLYRTIESRRIVQDELLLDLIIVGIIAALGHDLRENFRGWHEFETFALLFGAVFSSWRALVMYWNLWGVSGDLLDKAVVYTTVAMLTGIGVGAHGAFNVARTYVALAAFFASALPSAVSALFASREDLLAAKDNVVNQCIFTAAFQVLAAVPYAAAAFVPSPRIARILFWIPPIAELAFGFLIMELCVYLHRNRPNSTRAAVNIELIAEKYEIFTLIVLGESLLAILFEAAKFIGASNARVGTLFLSAMYTTALVYALQTLYINVDNKILHGSRHAIRESKVLGFMWSALHLPYLMCLVTLATGLGILLRDIVIPPATRSTFGQAQRWLFSSGWGGSIIISTILSSLHAPGPLEVTKFARLTARIALTLILTFGIPFTTMTAESYLLLHTLVTAAISILEFMLIHADAVGLFRSTSVKRFGKPFSTHDHRSDYSTEGNESNIDTEQVEQITFTTSPSRSAGQTETCPSTRALISRMNLQNRHRLEQVLESDRNNTFQ